MNARKRLRARWVLPVDRAPIEDGQILIDGETILSVGAAAEGAPAGFNGAPEDLGDVAIIPGLENAHTHLDLSDCPAPLGEPHAGFDEWIHRVVEFRRQPGRPSPHEVVAMGLRESLAAGVTSLGDIASKGWEMAPYEGARQNGVVFHEVIAPVASRFDESLDELKGSLQRATSDWNVGVSPHAPYTAPWEVFCGAVRLAKANNRPNAMHLAESPEEMEFLATGGGPCRAALEARGAWDERAWPERKSPRDFLAALADAGGSSLVIHGNFLNQADCEFLSRTTSMTLVYCPRTHARFGYTGHPAANVISLGGRVALGTDSRATNPDLSMLNEIRFLARADGRFSEATILEMATLRGAEALQFADRCGSLTPGKLANLAVLSLGDESRNPYAWMGEGPPPQRVMIQGEWI